MTTPNGENNLGAFTEHEMQPQMQLTVRGLPFEALRELGTLAARLGGEVTISSAPQPPAQELPEDELVTQEVFSAWGELRGITPKKAWNHIVSKSETEGNPFYRLVKKRRQEDVMSLRAANTALFKAYRTADRHPLGSTAALLLMLMIHEKISEDLPEAPEPVRASSLNHAAVYDKVQTLAYGALLGITYSGDHNFETIQSLGKLHVSRQPKVKHQIYGETMTLAGFEESIQYANVVSDLRVRNMRPTFTALKYVKALHQQGVRLGDGPQMI